MGDSKIKKESLSEGIVSCALIASCAMWLVCDVDGDWSLNNEILSIEPIHNFEDITHIIQPNLI